MLLDARPAPPPRWRETPSARCRRGVSCNLDRRVRVAALRHVGPLCPVERGMRTSIKRLLVKHSYPQDERPTAIKLAMDQMESMAPRFAHRSERASSAAGYEESRLVEVAELPRSPSTRVPQSRVSVPSGGIGVRPGAGRGRPTIGWVCDVCRLIN